MERIERKSDEMKVILRKMKQINSVEEILSYVKELEVIAERIRSDEDKAHCLLNDLERIRESSGKVIAAIKKKELGGENR